jgi:hypothetical protein
MKPKSLLVLLIAVAFIFSVSCKQKAKETAPAKAEAKETEEKEAKEEKGEEIEGSQEQAKKAKVELPAIVAKVVQENVPDAEIGSMTVENEGGIALYDIEFKADRGEIEVAEDGTVMDVATIIAMKDVPKAAAEAIQKAAADATIKQIEKSEVRAEIQKEGEKGKIMKLATAKYIYEAELVKGNQTAEIQVDPDGKVIEGPKWSIKEAEKK